MPVTKFSVARARHPETVDIHLLCGRSTGDSPEQSCVHDAAHSRNVPAEYTGNDIEISFVPVLVGRGPKRLLAESTLSP
jgi:hypothetical protein